MVKNMPQDNKENKSENSKNELDKVLEGLPEEKITKIKAIVALKSSTFSGPLPPPDLFAEYDKALPGATDRILSMAEKE